MAEQRKKSRPRRPGRIIEGDIALAEWADFAREEAAERRMRRWSVCIALGLHAGLAVVFGFFGALPTIGHEAEREKEIFVVQPVRFEPPPPRRQHEIPEPWARRVPIPDPTPDDPEPIVGLDEIDLEFESHDPEIIFGPVEAPPITSEGPLPVGGAVKAPIKISGPAPGYTEAARVTRIEGVVIVRAIVNKRGIVENVEVLKGLPMGLDGAAVAAVQKWRFEPATLHGEPVDVYYTLTVNFQLN